jgi:hypothetical protein
MGSMVKILVHVYKNSFTRQAIVTIFFSVFEPILPRYSNEYLNCLGKLVLLFYIHIFYIKNLVNS